VVNNGVIRGSSTSAKYLTPALWNDLHPREKLNVKYSTRIYLQCLLPVSLKDSFAGLGTNNQLTPISHPTPEKLQQKNDILMQKRLASKLVFFHPF